MKEIMVAYWSGTGNTAAMATILGKGSAAHPWEMKHLKKQ